MRAPSGPMTKNEDIWFCDANDFTEVYSHNVILNIDELNTLAVADNSNMPPPAHGALPENPD